MARVHQVQFVTSRRATCLGWKERVYMQMTKEISDWVDLARRQGWVVDATANNRLEWKPADKSQPVIHTSVKPVGATVRHVRRQLERAGLRFEEPPVSSSSTTSAGSTRPMRPPKPEPPELKAQGVTPSQALDVLIDYVAGREGDTNFKEIARGLSDELTTIQQNLTMAVGQLDEIRAAFMLPPWQILEKIAEIVGVKNPIGD